jgi:hypothetical protein
MNKDDDIATKSWGQGDPQQRKEKKREEKKKNKNK